MRARTGKEATKRGRFLKDLAGEILIARRASPQGPQKRGGEEEEEEREEKKKREEKETREEEEILHYVSCMQHFAAITEVSEL